MGSAVEAGGTGVLERRAAMEASLKGMSVEGITNAWVRKDIAEQILLFEDAKHNILERDREVRKASRSQRRLAQVVDELQDNVDSVLEILNRVDVNQGDVDDQLRAMEAEVNQMFKEEWPRFRDAENSEMAFLSQLQGVQAQIGQMEESLKDTVGRVNLQSSRSALREVNVVTTGSAGGAGERGGAAGGDEGADAGAGVGAGVGVAGGPGVGSLVESIVRILNNHMESLKTIDDQSDRLEARLARLEQAADAAPPGVGSNAL